MFCGNCGTQVPENVEVCPNCGKGTEKEVSFSDVTNYARKKAQQASAGMLDGIQGIQGIRQSQAEKKADRIVRDVSEMFVSDDEQAKKVVGGGYLGNWIQTGSLSKGFGVLTNRRFYYRGKCFHNVGGHYMKTDEDYTLDLQDITSSGFIYAKHLWMLLLAIAGFINAIVWIFAGETGIALGSLLASVLLLAAYYIFRPTMYTVTFAGGSLSFKASSFGIKELKAFDKALHQAKDEHLRSLR